MSLLTAESKLFKSLIISFLITLFSLSAKSQEVTFTIAGEVKDQKGVSLPGILVVVEEINKASISDINGKFEIAGIPEGKYTVAIQNIGYKPYKKLVNINKGTGYLSIPLEEEVIETQVITIEGKSKTQEAKEQAIKAEVIDTKAVKVQPVSLNELMNRSAGIRIRQTGGLGSSSNLMINGYQGKAIKYFKDGIPLDYLGGGYDISFVPVNALERLEVYKGVLPVSLGADALGGAVNMVSRKSLPKYAEFSYELGSFNTHRVSANAFYSDTAKKIFVGADAFYNHSDNDYKVIADVTDEASATRSPKEVRLFHNKFTNYFSEVYAGVRNTKWADELRIGLTGYWITRENQYGSNMSQPFGASVNRQYSVIPTLRYQKSLFENRLHIDQFLVINTIHSQQIDTAHGYYDWYGNFTSAPHKVGEQRVQGIYAKQNFSYFTSRTNLSYVLNPIHKLEFNAVYTGLSRVGNDPYGVKFKNSGTDILTIPAYYNKVIFAVGLHSKIYKETLSNIFIIKYYHYSTSYVDGDYYTGVEKKGSSSKNRWGFAEAIKLMVNQNSFIRLSAEVATRLPGQDEIFGDGNTNLSNFELKPEKSVNFNLGFRTQNKDNFTLEVNSFYRITKDLILRVAPVNFLFAQYQNIENVKGVGFETDVNYNLLQWLRANVNFTYQDYRLFNSSQKAFNSARLKNTPYFFANLGLNSQFNKVITGNDKLTIHGYYTFIKEYYLDYVPKPLEPEGVLGLWGRAQYSTELIIPDQHIFTAGFTYSPIYKLSFSFLIKNMTNSVLYDNYKIQNAGRSFHIKVNYLLK